MAKTKQVFVTSLDPLEEAALCVLDIDKPRTLKSISWIHAFLSSCVRDDRHSLVFVPYGSVDGQQAVLSHTPDRVILSTSARTAKIGYLFESADGIGDCPWFFSSPLDVGTKNSNVCRRVVESLTREGDLICDFNANEHAELAKWCRRLGRNYIGVASNPTTLARAQVELDQIEFPAEQMELLTNA